MAKQSNNIKIERQLYSVKELANGLGMSDDSVYRLIKAGEIRPVRLGGRVFVAHKELERILDGGK